MTLRSKIIFFLVLPVMIIIIAVAGQSLWRAHNRMLSQHKRIIDKELRMVSQELNGRNLEAVSVARTMAIAQMNGMFGRRQETIAFCRRILQVNPQFIGAYIGYEPNADGKDAKEIERHADYHPWMSEEGRFVPYWNRDRAGQLQLEPLVGLDEKDNISYQGIKEKFLSGHQEDFSVAEPYIYNKADLIVEHTSPIYIGNRFLGVAGINRSLDYLNDFLLNLKPFESAEFFVISGRGHLVASTLGEEFRTVSIDDFYVRQDGRILTEIFEWDDKTGMLMLNEDERYIANEKGVSSVYRELFKSFFLSSETTEARIFDDPISKGRAFVASAYIPTGNWRLVMTVSRDEIVAESRTALIQAVVLIVIGGAIILFVILVFSNRLSSRIGSANEWAQQIARGDLTGEVSVESNDETGQLQLAIKDMVNSLNGLLGQVKHATVQLVATTSRITGAAKEQENTIHDFSRTTSQIAGTVNQISVTSRELYGTMVNVSESAGDTAQLAETGHEQLAQMETSVIGLSRSTDAISGKLAMIEEKARNINQVVTAISKVSEQTHLLSLNASIEAEKAGEYGVGFAVVAREIRRLANQTAQATVDIDSMVKEMQGAVSSGVLEMDRFADEMRSGLQEIQVLGQGLEKIINQVQELTPRFDSVKKGMQSQAEGAEQINDAMTSLHTGVERTADSLREFDEATRALNKSVIGLKGEVSRFKVHENRKNTAVHIPFAGKIKK